MINLTDLKIKDIWHTLWLKLWLHNLRDSHTPDTILYYSNKICRTVSRMSEVNLNYVNLSEVHYPTHLKYVDEIKTLIRLLNKGDKLRTQIYPMRTLTMSLYFKVDEHTYISTLAGLQDAIEHIERLSASIKSQGETDYILRRTAPLTLHLKQMAITIGTKYDKPKST